MLESVRTATGLWGIVLMGIGRVEAIAVVAAADGRAAVVGVGVVAADAMAAAGRVAGTAVAAVDTRTLATDLHGFPPTDQMGPLNLAVPFFLWVVSYGSGLRISGRTRGH